MTDWAISLLLFGLSAASLAIAVMSALYRRQQWKEGGIEVVGSKESLFVKVGSLAVKYIGPRTKFFSTTKTHLRVDKLLIASGRDGGSETTSFIAARAVVAILGAMAASFLCPGPVIATSMIGALATIAYVDMSLYRKVQTRRVDIERSLPGVLDWLALSVEAGEGFSQALGKVVLRLPHGALKEELLKVHTEIQTGVPRRTAFSALARRVDVPSVSSLAALLIQADALGTSIGPVLKVCATRLRSERFSRAERQGVMAAQKALLPLLLCIMPATFLVIFGPIVTRFILYGIEGL